MIVLGISETHCATAAVLRDGEIVGCASEERFSRLKNDAGYPRRAVDALLRELGLTSGDVDRVVLAGTRIPSYEWMNRVMRDEAYTRRYYGVSLDAPRRGLTGRARKLRRPPHLPRGRRLLRVAVRRPPRARAHHRQLGRRSLRHRVERERRRPDPARGDAERPGLARLLLHARDPAARHEARRARVQGDGAGALRA